MRRRKAPPDRLSRDAMAAQAAGLSYGRYKVLHPHTEEVVSEEEPFLDDKRRNLTCQCCGKTFITDTKHANRLYCDDVCKQAAWTARSNARKNGNKTIRLCGICGKEIDGDKGRMYCGLVCRGEANRRRTEERNRRRKQEKESV